jgi:transposase
MVVHRKKYRAWDPPSYRRQPVCPEERLPEDDLVFFLLDLMPHLDLEDLYASYEVETRGAPPFEPALLLCLLFYAYCVGVYSSRKIAKACERNLAFLAIVGDDRPDFRTISDFRKEHLGRLPGLFVQVLRLAAEAGLVRLGNLAFDGSKFTGQASRHKAMSYGYMKKEEARLQEEIEALLGKAEKTDAEEDAIHGSRRGDDLPDELKRRQERLAVIQAAKARLEEQARAEAEAERQRRAEEEAERQRTGKKRRGKEPQPPSDVPKDKAQCSFTDPELKMMPQSNKGWDYAGNAQVSVDGAFQIIVACFVTDASNDKQQAIPLAEATRENLQQAQVALPLDDSGVAQKIPATLDSGYYSEQAASGLQERGFDPYMATKRQKHNQDATVAASAEPLPGEASVAVASLPETVAAASAEPLVETVAAAATAPAAETVAAATTEPLPAKVTAKEQMQAKLRTPQGQKLYAQRKTIVEPVFGQIKGARGFRRFLLKGLRKINGEWCLVCLTHNLLKLWRYRCAHAMS